jgi:hypothetical protein
VIDAERFDETRALIGLWLRGEISVRRILPFPFGDGFEVTCKI